MTAEESELPEAMDAWITDDADAAAGKTDSCTRAPACRSREIPGADGLVTPSQPIEARGTAKVIAAEVMMVLCMEVVKVPDDAEKIRERRSTALPVDGVTSGVFEGVCEFEGVGEDVSVVVDEIEIVGVFDGVTVGEEVRVVVVVGVGVAEGVEDLDDI